MPLFEFDAGQLVPAQVGHAVTDPVEPAVLDAVRAQVLELLRLPVFPVTWQDDDGAPHLTAMDPAGRSEEHTSELQSRGQLVCRLLLENKTPRPNTTTPATL